APSVRQGRILCVFLSSWAMCSMMALSCRSLVPLTMMKKSVIGDTWRISIKTTFSPFLSDARSTMIRANSIGSSGLTSISWSDCSLIVAQPPELDIRPRGEFGMVERRVNGPGGPQVALHQADAGHRPGMQVVQASSRDQVAQLLQ